MESFFSFKKMNFRKLFIFIFISAKAHPFAKLWDEFEQWPGLGFRGISTSVKGLWIYSTK